MLTKRQAMQGGAGTLGAVLMYGVWRDFRPDPLKYRAEHEAGFSVAVPKGFEVRCPAGKLHITNFDRTRKKWIEIKASGLTRRSLDYGTHLWPTLQTPAGRVRFIQRERKDLPGRWTLEASLIYAARLIYFHAVEDGSAAQPDFTFAWQVIGSVRT